MRRLVYILLGLMLVGVACRRSPRGVEARLVAIDSLMSAQPDSALALLAGINADSLPADLRAYHDMLTTQALYKAYIPATTDTLIARAWSYYRDHGPYDRRIRAMLYSGTTAEELGRPDSAMRWYKRTELESRPDDHYHRAYALKQMGILYQGVYETNYAKLYFNEAIKDFNSISDTINLMFCNMKLCQIYSETDIDSALLFGRVVRVLSAQSGHLEYANTINYLIGKYYFYEDQHKQAKDTTLSFIKNSDSSKIKFDTWCLLALCYIHLNKLDSAQYYFSKANRPKSVNDSILYYQYLSMLSKYNNDISNYIKYEELSNNIAADEMLKIKENSLQQIELKEEHSFLNIRNKRKLNLFLCIISIISLYFFRIIKQRKRLKQEIVVLQEFSDQLKKENALIQSRFNELFCKKLADDERARFVDHQNENDSDQHAQIEIKYNEMMESLSEVFRFLLTQIRKNAKNENEQKKLDSSIKNALTPSFFNYLRQYVDCAFNGLATDMEQSKLLKSNEINVLCLYLCRIPNSIIRIYTGLSTTQSAIRQRNNIAKKYFGSKQKFESLLTYQRN